MEQETLTPVGTVTRGETPLPSWLSYPDPPARRKTGISRELQELEYEQIFERVIEGIYLGKSLQASIQGDQRLISYEAFLYWIKKDTSRYDRFKDAQEFRTEFVVGEMLEISDGLDSIDPTATDAVNRDRLRIETRKWVVAAHNRRRYGETKQIELAGTISIRDALEQARARVIEAEVIDAIDVAPKQIEGE